jgi:hypothetical protein
VLLLNAVLAQNYFQHNNQQWSQKDASVLEASTSGIFGPKRDEVTGGWRKLH